MAEKLDFFMVLSYLDLNNMDVYSALYEDEDMIKEFRKNLNWILPQWMSCCRNNDDHAELVDKFNKMCNEKWFDLYGHPELQSKLLACCGLGRKVRHHFLKPSRARNVTKILDFLSSKYPDIKEEEVVLWCKNNEVSDIRDIATMMGLQEKEIRDLEKSYKDFKDQL